MVRKLLEYVFGRVNTFVLADAYPESVEVWGSKGGDDTLHAVMAIGRPSKPPSHDVELVTERIMNDDKILGCVESLTEDLLDRGARHVHERFCMTENG